MPRMKKIKIRNLIFNWPLIVLFVKEMIYLNAHYGVLWDLCVNKVSVNL